MSNLIPPRPRTVGTAVDGKRHFPIVASQFNSTYVQGLIDHATAELRTLIPGATTSLLQVPGALEIPLVVREIALQKRCDVLISIGVILIGKPAHADSDDGVAAFLQSDLADDERNFERARNLQERRRCAGNQRAQFRSGVID